MKPPEFFSGVPLSPFPHSSLLQIPLPSSQNLRQSYRYNLPGNMSETASLRGSAPFPRWGCAPDPVKPPEFFSGVPLSPFPHSSLPQSPFLLHTIFFNLTVTIFFEICQRLRL